MRRLEVEYVNASCALLRGYGSRDLVVEIRRKAPVWATRDRAWVVQPSTARDVIALAERRGYEICVSGDQETKGSKEPFVHKQLTPGFKGSKEPLKSETSDPAGGLW